MSYITLAVMPLEKVIETVRVKVMKPRIPYQLFNA